MNYAFATRSRPALFASLLAATMLLAPAAASAQSFSDDQKQAIEGIIKDYCSSTRGAAGSHERIGKEAAGSRRRKGALDIKDNNATLFNSPHQVVLGNPQGNITMVEFFDYNCAIANGRCPTC